MIDFSYMNLRGSTCYMNSLLQVMFMTAELRAGLFAVDPMELGFKEVLADSTIVS